MKKETTIRKTNLRLKTWQHGQKKQLKNIKKIKQRSGLEKNIEKLFPEIKNAMSRVTKTQRKCNSGRKTDGTKDVEEKKVEQW